jgi:hypothetical protein
MAILRAGPFASSSSSFLNQPEPIIAHPTYSLDGAVPTNCASAFPFRSYVSRAIFPSLLVPEIQLKESGSELINTSNENQPRSHRIFAMFRYQAARDFNVKLHYAISASATAATVTCLVGKKIGTNNEEYIESLIRHSLGNSGPINIDNEVVIPLTASVVPRFVGFQINFTVFSGFISNLTSDTSLILKPD